MDAYIFDLDGTVMDTMGDLVELTNTVLREFDMPERTFSEIQGFVGNGALALMYQAVPEGAPSDVVEAALARWKELNPSFIQQTHPYPGIPETLGELKRRGAKLGLLSNKFDGGVQILVAERVPNVFDLARGEGPNVPRKPDPKGLLDMIADLGTTPDKCVYVGDSPGDMLTAKNAGCMAVGVDWGYRKVEDIKAAGADVVISSPRELLSL